MQGLSLILVMILILPSMAQESQSKIEREVEKNLVSGLLSSQVQDQLELIAEQKEEFTRLADALKQRHEELKEEMQRFQKSGVSVDEAKEKQAELQAMFDEVKKQTRVALLAELLPHQQTRLKETMAQLLVEKAAREKKAAASLLVPEVRDYLEIKAPQAKRIEAKAKKLQAEIAEKIRKFQVEARKELLAELDDGQREKFDKLFGEAVSIPLDSLGR